MKQLNNFDYEQKSRNFNDLKERKKFSLKMLC